MLKFSFMKNVVCDADSSPAARRIRVCAYPFPKETDRVSVLNNSFLSKLGLGMFMFMIRRNFYGDAQSEGLGDSILLPRTCFLWKRVRADTDSRPSPLRFARRGGEETVSVTFSGKIRSYLNLEELSKGLNMGLEDLRLKLKGGKSFYSVTMSDYVRLKSINPLLRYKYCGQRKDDKRSILICNLVEILGLSAYSDFSAKDLDDYFLLNDDFFMTVNYLMFQLGADGHKISKELFTLRVNLLRLIVNERPSYLIRDLSTGKEYVRKSLFYTAIELSREYEELAKLLKELKPLGNGAYIEDGKTGRLYELELTRILPPLREAQRGRESASARIRFQRKRIASADILD
jgi:hypothetical protein